MEEYLDEEKGIIDLTGVNVNSWNRDDLISLLKKNPKVKELKLAGTGIQATSLRYLFSSAACKEIEKLDLSDNKLVNDANNMSVIPFTRSLLPNLTALNLHGNYINDDNLEIILKFDLTAQFKELVLSDNNIGDRGVKGIANTKFDKLENLVLSDNKIYMGVIDIFTSSNFPEIKELDLSNNGIGDAGIRKIKEYYDRQYHKGNSYGLNSLLKLYLDSTYITASGVRDLSNMDCFPKLTTLCLGNFNDVSSGNVNDENSFGDTGVKAIVDSQEFRNLTHLSLLRQKIIGRHIAKSPYLKNLKVLDVRYNDIYDNILKEILASQNLPKLKELHLNGNSSLSLPMVMDAYKWGADKGIEIFFDSNVDTLLKAIYETSSLMDIIFQLCELEVKQKIGGKEIVVKPGIVYVLYILNQKDQYHLNVDSKDSQGRSFYDLYTQYPNLRKCLETIFTDHKFFDNEFFYRQISGQFESLSPLDESDSEILVEISGNTLGH